MFFGKPIKTISPRELQLGLETGDIVLFDVREAGEHKGARIEPSTLVPLSQFDTSKIKAPEGKKIVLYCQSGMRSGQAARACEKAGIEVSNLAGGIMTWHGQGFPIKSGA
jgi:rhodanese-related sulfurtransferase